MMYCRLHQDQRDAEPRDAPEASRRDAAPWPFERASQGMVWRVISSSGGCRCCCRCCSFDARGPGLVRLSRRARRRSRRSSWCCSLEVVVKSGDDDGAAADDTAAFSSPTSSLSLRVAIMVVVFLSLAFVVRSLHVILCSQSIVLTCTLYHLLSLLLCLPLDDGRCFFAFLLGFCAF